MPIRSHLNGHRFDPETMRLMGIAYEMTLISLRLVDRGDIVNNVVAQKLIEIAKAGERDPERLCKPCCNNGIVPSHMSPRPYLQVITFDPSERF